MSCSGVNEVGDIFLCYLDGFGFHIHVIVGYNHANVYHAVALLSLGVFLVDEFCRVDILYGVALVIAVFSEYGVKHGGGSSEEDIVEVYDICFRTVVGVEIFQLHILSLQILVVGNITEQAPVAVSPSVDTLLDITHDEILRIFVRHTFKQQFLEVFPLHGTRILKLVYHDVGYPAAYLLEDEGGVAIFHQLVEQILSAVKQKAVGLLVNLLHLLLDIVEQSQFVDMAEYCLGGGNVSHMFLSHFLRFIY